MPAWCMEPFRVTDHEAFLLAWLPGPDHAASEPTSCYVGGCSFTAPPDVRGKALRALAGDLHRPDVTTCRTSAESPNSTFEPIRAPFTIQTAISGPAS